VLASKPQKRVPHHHPRQNARTNIIGRQSCCRPTRAREDDVVSRRGNAARLILQLADVLAHSIGAALIPERYRGGEGGGVAAGQPDGIAR
jgi:hypothetical protein